MAEKFSLILSLSKDARRSSQIGRLRVSACEKKSGPEAAPLRAASPHCVALADSLLRVSAWRAKSRSSSTATKTLLQHQLMRRRQAGTYPGTLTSSRRATVTDRAPPTAAGLAAA